MPLFHVHTFLALSAVLAFWLVIGTGEMRKQIAILLAAAFLPATWIVWMITDHFRAKSILAWAPGWLQSDPGFSNSAFKFWIENFGLTLPGMIALFGIVVWRWAKKAPPVVVAESAEVAPVEEISKSISPSRERNRRAFAFVVPAAGVFLFACFVKTAPWGWDNTKLIIWAYFICLPFLWSELIAGFLWPVRAGLCFVLFVSGFVSLIGGLKVGSPGFDIADRIELNALANVLEKIPVKERFAAFPVYNHPLLLDGRKLVLGYPGHLWTQGFDYGPIEQQLNALMLGAPDWRERATLCTRAISLGSE